jgi:hypothetical protein
MKTMKEYISTAEGMNQMWEKINEVLDGFDFTSVVSVMEALDWTWMCSEGEADLYETEGCRIKKDENGKYAYCEVSTGDIPFNPYGFQLPAGKQPCSLDNSVSPMAIRLSSGEVLARYRQGQFVVPFQLDCSDISYEFWFK